MSVLKTFKDVFLICVCLFYLHMLSYLPGCWVYAHFAQTSLLQMSRTPQWFSLRWKCSKNKNIPPLRPTCGQEPFSIQTPWGKEALETTTGGKTASTLSNKPFCALVFVIYRFTFFIIDIQMWIISVFIADHGGKVEEAASLWFVLLSHQLWSKLNTNDSFIICIQLYSRPCVFFSFTFLFWITGTFLIIFEVIRRI